MTTPIPLTALGLPGEAWPRMAALARIEALEREGLFVEAIDAYALDDGALRFLYESWTYEDEQGLYDRNLKQGAAASRAFIWGFVFEDDGEPVFRLHTRTMNSPTAPRY